MATGMIDSTFQDPAAAFEAQAKQLERRRALAKALIERGMNSNDTGAGYNGGRVYMVGGGPLGQIANAVGGEYIGRQADEQQASLDQSQQQAAQALIQRLATPGSKEQMGPTQDGSPMPQGPLSPEEESARRLGIMGEGLGNPSIRSLLEKQMGQELDYPRQREQEAARQAIENARLEAQDKRQVALFGQQTELLDKRLKGQQELRQIPTVHVSMGGGGSSPGDEFGGPAVVIGSNPRDDSPVYRHTKSNKLFQYGPDGRAIRYEGLTAGKPVAEKVPTEAERSSAGYLGRMEAAEKNLTNAKPLPYLQQRGLERAPGLTNYTLTQEQQVTRQQQEDWVRAKLRKESGAVIGDEEMAREIRTYFPQAGDGPKVLAAKEQSRAQAREQMKSSAGRVKPVIAAPTEAVERKTVGGKNYVKRGGDWYAE